MIFSTLQPLILASKSPRRSAFLKDLGLNFTIDTEEIDETPHPGELPKLFVERMAREKAQVVSQKNRNSFVIAADTIVCLENRILGKPRSHEEAVDMLMALSGRSHVVRTSFCVVCLAQSMEKVSTVATDVFFSRFSEKVARGYVNCGESLDKAGAYGIQGKGVFLVERISGSYSNVVGLPMAELTATLQKLSVIAPALQNEQA